MYDQSYNTNTLGNELKRKDFRAIAPMSLEAFRARLLHEALQSVDPPFSGANPIRRFHLKRKHAYAVRRIEDDLVVRKLTRNLRQFLTVPQRGRDFVVRNLQRMLEEGVPYRVYRFDVKSFYESVSDSDIADVAARCSSLDPRSKGLLTSLIENYRQMGGHGVPRGMGISAVISELVMLPFDRALSQYPGVYFFARYVDDILIITAGSEADNEVETYVRQRLPVGMSLNPKKKDGMHATEPASSKKAGEFVGAVEYLGYKFSVFEPEGRKAPFRKVAVDIAESKLAKIKRRIVRSLVAFTRDGNFELLMDRLRLLSSNFAINDVSKGRRRLAGIYHGYPRLSQDAKSLKELDKFVREGVLIGRGRLFATVKGMLSPGQRRELLGASFVKGHSTRRFLHFHPIRIGELQECWKYE